MNHRVASSRIRPLNGGAVLPSGRFILYWMMANRRLHWNAALDRAVERSAASGLPLVIAEPLELSYPWASHRLHRFVIEGMCDNAADAASSRVHYIPLIECKRGQIRRLFRDLCSRAAFVVTDDHPGFWFPRQADFIGTVAPCGAEAVDASGIIPFRSVPRAFPTVRGFRTFATRYMETHPDRAPGTNVLQHLSSRPDASLREELSRLVTGSGVSPVADPSILPGLRLDRLAPVAGTQGGRRAALSVLERFLDRLDEYEFRNDVHRDSASGLSPYLHFGHVSSAEVVRAVRDRCAAAPETAAAAGKFLDQIIMWRELSLNMCAATTGYDRFESLPAWSQRTLLQHSGDRRQFLYGQDAFEEAATHDPLWNAAQNQLVREGRMHNYLRMLWGKKILEWTRHPEQALEIMIHLNNKYALDGRDPNSYAGITWILGRFDRPWGPERPVFGTVRYMTSAQTARKYRVREYVERYSTSVAIA